ncbi:MAG TPA: serpin family protein [Firmicutes bacterium]|nr:serpin family protein [Bacillota bacterium]
MKSRSLIFFAVLLCSLISISVFGDKIGDQGKTKAYVSGLNEFGFSMFDTIINSDGPKNTFISPASISIALSMALNGADGETFTAMQETMHLQKLTLDQINEETKNVITSLMKADKKVELMIANSLWLRKGQSFKKDFLDANKKFYGAEVGTYDFGDPSTVTKINNWVKKSTKNKIEKIIDKIDPLAIAFLINAIYFKGSWTSEFDEADTKEETFHMTKELNKKHPLMYQEKEFRYYESEKLQAIRLPYGKEKFSMYVFLPSYDYPIEEFMKDVKIEKYREWTNSMNKVKVRLKLPKFKLEYDKLLNSTLQSLGMKVAFDEDAANFGKMCNIPPNVFIQKVLHKTYIEVNEEGTEAAAVTAIQMGIKSAPPRDVYEMFVTRPFFFTIQDDETGLILFMGLISDPE